MIKIAPSLACADFLHMEDEIRKFEKNNIDYIHYDICDTTFTNTIMLPIDLLKQIKDITKIPIDIHIMVRNPDEIVEKILPWLDENDIVSLQVESSDHYSNYLVKIKEKCKCGVVVNMGTGLDSIEYVAELVDLVTLIQGNAGAGPRHNYPEIIGRKIEGVKEMMKRVGNDHCQISVDGNINFTTAPIFKKYGANILVCGTKTLFTAGTQFDKQVKLLNEALGQ